MKDYPAKKKKKSVKKYSTEKFIVETLVGHHSKVLLCTLGGTVLKTYQSMTAVMRDQYMKGVCYGPFRAQMLSKGFYWINKDRTAKLIFEQPRIDVKYVKI